MTDPINDGDLPGGARLPPLSTPTGWFSFAWAVAGFLALMGDALYRLTPIAAEALRSGLSSFQWAALIVWVVAMAYMEGYRGFQLRFSPRFAARAMALAAQPTPLRIALAPLYCMGLFHARRRILIVSWGIVIGVVALILAIRLLHQPWRGIVDAGVVVGLGWGLAATIVSLARAVRVPPSIDAADLPDAP